jgi:sec-independent protein translocase protein TatA
MVQALLFIDSPEQILLILVIALFIFGPTKLPQLGSSFGKAIRSYREGLRGEALQTQPDVAAAPASQEFCTQCGAGRSSGSVFCTRCGRSFQG